MNQSEFEGATCNAKNARENELMQVAIGFAFHW